MFPRGRPCLRGCGFSAVLDQASARAEEPLLFLYPPWFSSLFRQHRRAISSSSPSSITSTTSPRRIPSRVSGGLVPRTRTRPPPRRQSFGFSSRRWISTATKTNADDIVSSSLRGRTAATLIDDSVHPGENSGREHGTGEAMATSPSWSGNTVAVAGQSGSFNAFAGLVENREAVSPPLVARRHRRRRRLSSMWMGDTIDPSYRVYENTTPETKLAPVVRLSTREKMKLRNRVYRLERLVSQPRRVDGGVRGMLERLERSSRAQAHRRRVQGRVLRLEKLKEILVPEETIALLAGLSEGSMAENIWYIPIHNGCRVHVLPPIESEGKLRKVVISGSDRVVQLVAGRIQQTQALQERGDPLVDIRKPQVPVFPSLLALERRRIPAPLVRGVWDFHSASRQPVQIDLILNRSQTLSTIRDFVEHVEELTISLPSTDPVNSVPPPPPHPERVAQVLQTLFVDDKTGRLVSTAALNSALSFLVENEFLKLAQEVFTLGQHVATVDTFNILLKSAAKKQNIPFFRSVLRVMTRIGVCPNAFTWLAYLDCLISPAAKVRLIKVIERKGYLREAPAMRTALQLTIQDTLAEHLQGGGTVDEFFDHAVEVAGLDWFPPSLVHQMFSVLIRLRDVSAMDRLVEICKQHDLTIPVSIIKQVARLFRSDFYSTLSYLFRCSDNNPNLKLNGETYERLFLSAFKNQHYNICRVLWRYACMNGTVTYQMKDAMSFSLVQNVGRSDLSKLDNMWRTSAGKVIIGVDLHLPEYPLKRFILKNFPPEFHEHPVSYLVSGFKEKGEERSKQLRAARALIQRDVEVGSWYRPTYPLPIMLEAAAVLDKEWKDVPRPTKWLIQNAIHVPVEISDFSV